MRVSEGLVTSPYRRNLEEPGVLLAERNAVTKQAEFNRVSADRGARVLDLGTLDKSEDHEALHLGVGSVNGLDNASLTAFQGCERVTVESHIATIWLIFRHFPDNCRNDNDSH